MNYKTSSIDIIESVVSAMEFPVIITDIDVVEAGVFRLTVCDIYHTQIGFNVTIDGYDYEIIDFSFESSTIVVRGDMQIVVTSFELYHPVFYHGTLAATDVETNQQADANAKTPMIWMREMPMKDKFNTSTETAIEREMGDTSLFFLSQTNQEEYQTEQAYQYVIMPMRRLQERFLEKMGEMISLFNLIEWDYQVINYAKLAVYASGKSTQKAFFVDKLAGCEMPLTGLKIWREGLCAIEC